MASDVIILGGGPAGLSAARWCVELGLMPVVIERNAEAGGQLLWIHNRIENHLGGGDANNGREMRDLMLGQMADSCEIRRNAKVVSADLRTKSIGLANGAILTASALVLATGVRRRKLSVPGEKEFAGKGIIVSGARDRETVRGRKVCIIGGGDAAFENALLLAEFAESVTLVHRRGDFSARAEFIERVENDRKITVLTDTIITAIKGKDTVESVALSNNKTGENISLPAQAVLVRIGIVPNTELFQNQVNLDSEGFIEVTSRCETSAEYVYAAGDVAAPFSKSISTAVGMGATAARAILAKLSGS